MDIFRASVGDLDSRRERFARALSRARDLVHPTQGLATVRRRARALELLLESVAGSVAPSHARHVGDPAEKRRRPTYADIEALPPNVVGEIIAGELVVMPRPPRSPTPG